MSTTRVSISGDDFLINDRKTYHGRVFDARRIEGLLLNSRMVQAIFDDLNPATRDRWKYHDGSWDPDRNTREMAEMLPLYRDHGLLAVTVNLQGGSPEGYSQDQPWVNSAFEADGALRPAFMSRLHTVLESTDRLGMVVILGLFYFGQDQHLRDELAVKHGVDAVIDWIVTSGFTNVLIEINNEADVPHYTHDILKPSRVGELIVRARAKSGGSILVGTSFGGGTIPPEDVVEVSDFLLVHGNGVAEPARIRQMVDECRSLNSYRGQPVVFNEDDHFDFDKPDNNMLAALDRHASWGFFDYRLEGEDFDEGFQSVPVNWGISSGRKRGFFSLLSRVSGA